LYDQVEAALASLPGVSAVTSSRVSLLTGDNWGHDVWAPGFPTGPDVDRSARYNEVGAGYFAALGVRLVAGREFTLADRRGAPDVAVVNRAFTKKFGLTRSAVGAFLSLQGPNSMNVRVVGVVPDVKYSQVKDTVPPVYYVPWRQDAHNPSMSFFVRTARSQAALREIPIGIKRIDPGIPVEDLRTMPEQIRENVFLDRMISLLCAAFAALATLLAAVGLYGVLAYTVAQRTREIGVRIALGADGPRVQGLVLRQVSGMLAAGGAIGLAGALGLGRAARSLLFGLTGNDPLVFGCAVLTLALVALGAAYLPARRASLVDPMVALRHE
jgi:predicted permease